MKGYSEKQGRDKKKKAPEKQCPQQFFCQSLQISFGKCKYEHSNNDKSLSNDLSKLRQRKSFSIYFAKINQKSNLFHPVCIAFPNLPISVQEGSKQQEQTKINNQFKLGVYYRACYKQKDLNRKVIIIKILEEISSFGNFLKQKQIFKELDPYFIMDEPKNNKQFLKGFIKMNWEKVKVLKNTLGKQRPLYLSREQQKTFPFPEGCQVSYTTKKVNGRSILSEVYDIKFQKFKFTGILKIDSGGTFYVKCRNDRYQSIDPINIPEKLGNFTQMQKLLPYSIFGSRKIQKEKEDNLNKKLEGFIVQGEFLDWPLEYKNPIGKLLEQYSELCLKSLKNAIIFEYVGQVMTHSERQKKESQKILKSIQSQEEKLKQEQIQDQPLTIDSSGTACFDDAIKIQEIINQNGDKRFSVSIFVADVDRFVSSADKLNQIIKEKEKTIYIKGCNSPMFYYPLLKSFSLKEGKIRYTFCLKFTIDDKGVVDFNTIEFSEKKVRVKKNFYHKDSLKEQKELREVFSFNNVIDASSILSENSIGLNQESESEGIIQKLMLISSMIPTMMWKINKKRIESEKKKIDSYMENLAKNLKEKIKDWQQEIKAIKKNEQAKQKNAQERAQMKKKISKQVEVEIKKLKQEMKQEKKAKKQKKKQEKIKQKKEQASEESEVQSELQSITDKQKTVASLDQKKQKQREIRQLQQDEKIAQKIKQTIKNDIKIKKQKLQHESSDDFLSDDDQKQQSREDHARKLNQAKRALDGYIQKVLSLLKIEIEWEKGRDQIRKKFSEAKKFDKSQIFKQFIKRMYIMNSQHFRYIIQLKKKQKEEIKKKKDEKLERLKKQSNQPQNDLQITNQNKKQKKYRRKAEEKQTEEKKPEKIEEIKPNKIDEKKPEKIEEIKPNKIDEKKPEKIEEIKPNKIDEKKPEKIEEIKPNKIDEKKPEKIEEIKPNKIDEKKPEKIEEIKVEKAEEQKTEIGEEKKVEKAEEKKDEKIDKKQNKKKMAQKQQQGQNIESVKRKERNKKFVKNEKNEKNQSEKTTLENRRSESQVSIILDKFLSYYSKKEQRYYLGRKDKLFLGQQMNKQILNSQFLNKQEQKEVNKKPGHINEDLSILIKEMTHQGILKFISSEIPNELLQFNLFEAQDSLENYIDNLTQQPDVKKKLRILITEYYFKDLDQKKRQKIDKKVPEEFNKILKKRRIEKMDLKANEDILKRKIKQMRQILVRGSAQFFQEEKEILYYYLQSSEYVDRKYFRGEKIWKKVGSQEGSKQIKGKNDKKESEKEKTQQIQQIIVEEKGETKQQVKQEQTCIEKKDQFFKEGQNSAQTRLNNEKFRKEEQNEDIKSGIQDTNKAQKQQDQKQASGKPAKSKKKNQKKLVEEKKKQIQIFLETKYLSEIQNLDKAKQEIQDLLSEQKKEFATKLMGIENQYNVIDYLLEKIQKIKKKEKSKSKKKKMNKEDQSFQDLQAYKYLENIHVILKSFEKKAGVKFPFLKTSQIQKFLSSQINIQGHGQEQMKALNTDFRMLCKDDGNLLKWNNPIRSFEALETLRILKEYDWVFNSEISPLDILIDYKALKEIKMRIGILQKQRIQKIDSEKMNKKHKQANRQIEKLQFFYQAKRNPDKIILFLNVTSPSDNAKFVFHPSVGELQVENRKFKQQMFRPVQGRVRIIRQFPIQMRVQLLKNIISQ